MISFKLFLLFLILIFLLKINLYFLDWYVWEKYLYSCEKLKHINNFGEKLKVNPSYSHDLLVLYPEFQYTKINTLEYYYQFDEFFYNPVGEFVRYSLVLNNDQRKLYSGINVLLPRKFKNYAVIFSIKWIKNVSFFAYEMTSRIKISRNYRTFDHEFIELYHFKDLNYRYHLKNFNYTNNPDLHPFFLTIYWNEVLPVCRGVYSCQDRI